MTSKNGALSAALIGAAMLLSIPSAGWAAATGEASLRASLLEGRPVPGVTIGVDHERLYRTVKPKGTRTRNLEVESNGVFVGVPLAPWLQAFGVGGYAQAKHMDEREDWGDGFFRGRIGLAAHLWHADVPAPEFMAGGVSFRAAIDYGYGKFDDDEDSGHWHEGSLTATMHYEILAEERPGRVSYPYSLDLYAGPVAQWISGERDIEGATRSFDQAQVGGLAFGANLFLTPRLSLGAHMRLFDTFTWSAGLRLTF